VRSTAVRASGSIWSAGSFAGIALRAAAVSLSFFRAVLIARFAAVILVFVSMLAA
jgi:hypothetical protein